METRTVVHTPGSENATDDESVCNNSNECTNHPSCPVHDSGDTSHAWNEMSKTRTSRLSSGFLKTEIPGSIASEVHLLSKKNKKKIELAIIKNIPMKLASL